MINLNSKKNSQWDILHKDQDPKLIKSLTSEIKSECERLYEQLKTNLEPPRMRIFSKAKGIVESYKNKRDYKRGRKLIRMSMLNIEKLVDNASKKTLIKMLPDSLRLIDTKLSTIEQKANIHSKK